MTRRIPLAFLVLAACPEEEVYVGDPPPWELVGVTLLTDDGGRVDWSPDGATVAFDRLGDDGIWQLWWMNADGSGQECLTCDHPDISGHAGQPAFHPSGDWLVFQAESPDHPVDVMPTTPGAGVYNDLVAMRISDRELFVIHDVADVGVDDKGGTLHPVFDHAGERLMWTDYERSCWTCPVGDWQVAIAGFEVDADDEPRLVDQTNYNPGIEGLWYETHGFGPDDDTITFSGSTEGQLFLAADIIRMDLATEQITRLTQTSGKAGEKFAYDEHAKLNPDGDAMMWLNDESGISEYWMANPDGTGRFQVTHFNTDGHAHSDLVGGLRSVPSDNAWNPAAPAGTASALGFVQVDFDIFSNSAASYHIYRLDFARTEG